MGSLIAPVDIIARGVLLPNGIHQDRPVDVERQSLEFGDEIGDLLRAAGTWQQHEAASRIAHGSG